MERERELHFDLLRIFSIFSMMILHIAAGNWSSEPVSSFNWQVFNIYDSLVRFCVPIFVMISGGFLLDPQKDISLRTLFRKYILRIVTAFLFWSLSYAISGTPDFHLWFMYTILALYLIAPFLRKITPSRTLCVYFMILSFVFGMMIPTMQKLWDIPWLTSATAKMSLFFVLGYSGYFVAGYFLRHHILTKRTKGLIYLLGLAGALITMICTAYVSMGEGVATSVFYSYLSPNCTFLTVAVFVFFKEEISKIKFGRIGRKIVAELSKCSFAMYLVHVHFIMIFANLGLTSTTFNPILSIPAIAILVFCCSFVVAFILSKIPFLNRYIM